MAIPSDQQHDWLAERPFVLAFIAYRRADRFGVDAVIALPLLALILVCPLMMFFMMKGMNKSGDDPGTTKKL